MARQGVAQTTSPIDWKTIDQFRPDIGKELIVADYKSVPIVIEKVDSTIAGLDVDTVTTRTELRLRSVGLRPRQFPGQY